VNKKSQGSKDRIYHEERKKRKSMTNEERGERNALKHGKTESNAEKSGKQSAAPIPATQDRESLKLQPQTKPGTTDWQS
jgi:hypothetical protein